MTKKIEFEVFLFLFLGGRPIEEREIDSLLIQPGDSLKVLPGTKIPADGVVMWGSSYINESMVTGESVPVLKEVDAIVIGGTINLQGVLLIQATKVGSDTVLSQIISLVETAQMSKAPIQKFADYVSTVVIIVFDYAPLGELLCSITALVYDSFALNKNAFSLACDLEKKHLLVKFFGIVSCFFIF